MEECAYLCGLGSLRGCPCPQERQRPAETSKAEGKRYPQKRQRPAETAQAEGKLCPQKRQCPAEKAAAEGKPAPPHCSLQDLPVEILVEIFASLPGTDLPSMALACTKFRHILHIDSIWRQRCREEFGVCENLQNLEAIGTSYREVYAKLLHPYRHILGLWQLDTEDYKTLVYVAVDGLGITGWTYVPCFNTHVNGPMQLDPSFRIRLTERKSATVECMECRHRRPHSCHLQIQKDRLTSQCKKTEHGLDSPTQLRELGQVLPLQYDRQAYRRLYLSSSHPDDLIRPGLFQSKYYDFSLMVFMLSFHRKYARVTEITGILLQTLEIHLMRRIPLRDGEIFRDFNELSHVVQEIDEQVLREQQQQQEDGTEESEGHGWQSPAQSSIGESGASAAEEQPVPFVLPVGVCPKDQNYPRTCRMCFYAVDTGTLDGSACRDPGVFILFDENHFGFIDLEEKSFFLYGRVQNTFQNVEAPSPQAFLEMLKNIQQVSHRGLFF